ncbi:hypothetical protein ZEAMMB73_Zm00001d019705 [Zea mays]|uniref:Uncharacterized protein n=1 Tax=Zea mays TaxID=4577 RepID=A0A1D6HZV3_MAIZE|nr:hypothetical protein ZEAMMB73_Zm00001d019705 [Zea mays]
MPPLCPHNPHASMSSSPCPRSRFTLQKSLYGGQIDTRRNNRGEELLFNSSKQAFWYGAEQHSWLSVVKSAGSENDV